MNGFDLSTISDLYVGSTQYSAIYLGLQKIWERNTEYINQYLTIESLEDNNVIDFTSSIDQTVQRTIYVNKNNTGWYSVTSGPQIQVATLNTGDKLKIYGSSSTYTYSKDCTENNSCIFGSTKTVNLYGNICTLLTDGNIPTSSIDLSGSQYNNCFCNIFRNLLVVDASNLVFGAIESMGRYTCCWMFYGCTSLTVAPELPTLKLGNSASNNTGCYQEMFKDCTSLTTGPSILPAPILLQRSYYGMFRGCTSLITAPELPATSLNSYCCYQMFFNCTSLTTAPSILPAIRLNSYCYYQMFNNCTSLTTAPVLPATTLVSNCYESMFYKCSSLNYIKALFTTTPSTTYTSYWVYKVAASGTFIKSPDATWSTKGENGVPTGWTVVQYNNQYLTIESLEDNNVIDFYSAADATVQRTINVRINSSEWYSVTSGPSTTIATLNTGDKLEIYGNSKTLRYSKDGKENNSCIFGSTKTVNLYGNICTLLTNGDLPINMDLASKYSYCFGWLFADLKVVDASNLVFPITKMPLSGFSNMFNGCTSLTTAPTILPTTTLASNCYESMFRDCTSLTTAPALPATTLAEYCYTSMFSGCTSLTTAPELPATTLAEYCYRGMFNGCTSLTAAPELPATTLVQRCYMSMFSGCTSLTTAPEELPATTLTNYCYHQMFYGCTSLTTAPELPATTLANYCYGNMFQGCTSLTAVPELPATTLTNYCYQNMFRYCTSLTAAPELPATTLTNNCYQNMFQGCTSLSYIKCLATNISALQSHSSWLLNVAATGTFVKPSSMTSWPMGSSGIPRGWTVIDV